MDFLKNQALKKYNQVKAAVLKHSYKLQASTFGFLVIFHGNQQVLNVGMISGNNSSS